MSTHTINEGSVAASGTTVSVAVERKLTYSDALEHLTEFAAGHGSSAAQSLLRRAVLRAYDEVVNAHDWPFMRSLANVYCHEAQTDGTLSYDHDTLTATLTGATFPDWTDGASLYLDGITCDINQRISSTTATLRATMAPGEDLSGESYTLYRRWYALPDDWLSMEEPLGEEYATIGSLVSWGAMAQLHRWEQLSGTIDYWCIGQAPSGGVALFVYPALDSDVRLLLPYRRRPRDLRITGQEADDYVGTIAVSGTTITGTTTAFRAAMEGSILRISDDTNPPTSLEGRYPYLEELVIGDVTTTTAMTTTSSGTTASDVAYRVTDAIDLDRSAWDAFLRCAEMHFARMRNIKEYPRIKAEYDDALRRAKGASAGEQPNRKMGGGRPGFRRLADYYTP